VSVAIEELLMVASRVAFERGFVSIKSRLNSVASIGFTKTRNQRIPRNLANRSARNVMPSIQGCRKLEFISIFPPALSPN